MESLSLSSSSPFPFFSSFSSSQTTTKTRTSLAFTHRSIFTPRATMDLSSQNDAKPKEAKLWGGRFEKGVTDVVEKFTESISFDKALYKHDIMGSKAHASMLAKQGLISECDRDRILQGLDEIERRIESGLFEWRMDREDVHMNIEAALTEMIGEPAKKLHTARSRNDQVLTDFRLWCRDAIDRIVPCIKSLQVALVNLALDNEGLIVPGYTHLQRAQPVLLPHLLLAFVEQLERDAGRLLDCRARLNFCPLGACALAGTGLPIDRFMTSDALGFTAPMRNSIDAVSDRDFVLEFLSANSIIAIHLSRLGEEWVLWASEEFGFITPSDSVSTGSSIMPQKKNPDPMELVRGKSARVIGDLVTLLTLCKGLPLAYNRDLQEDKEPVFDSVKTIIGMLEVSAEFAQNISFNLEKIQKSLPAGHLDATTLADYLVKKGMPFRTSHDVVGRSVALCVYKNCQLQDLSLEDMRSIDPVFDEDVYDYLGAENSVKKFCSYGSTGSTCVATQLDYWATKLEVDRNTPRP
ncbi:L-Aspartase-like family protein [Tripterygium wilfordii]|uniref:argininosuccinate lyase n=1 Tax=Tripterygium wilfordii TaxID=458696 RepID=A0A7J7D134_TRIWF|nr:argininosuccinate lyase, chloroplastic [Tripterygium wilfordii]KAF5739786.1 L-Aspartase-like family protein [Tripterygium wilfordii]